MAFYSGIESLFQSVKEGDLEQVQKILVSNKDLFGDDRWIDYALLVTALQRDHRNIAKLLLKMGCRVNRIPNSNVCHTPLYYAVGLNDVDLVKKLLAKEASINDKKNGEETPLTLAMRNKQFEIVDLMLSRYHFSRINPNDENDITHFLIACERNKLNVLKSFVKSGMSVNNCVNSNYSTCSGYAPLHFAVRNANLDAVEFLLNRGADFTVKDSNGWTPLQLASQVREKLFLTRNADTAEIEAIIDKILLSHGSNLNLIDDENMIISHFHIACTRDEPVIIKRFLQCGVDINCCVPVDLNAFSGFTALHFAVHNSCIKVIEFLLNHGANINAKTKEGWTPLNFAVAYGLVKIVKLLLKRGAEVSIESLEGLTPLQYAFHSARRNDAIVDLLLFHDSKETNPANTRGLSHFHIACSRNEPGIVEAFLKNNVSVDAKVDSDGDDYSGYTALHFAVEFNQKDVVEVLLKYRATVNVREDKKLTPLHLACRQNYINLHEMINQYSVEIPDEEVSIWRNNCENQVKIVKLLLHHNADADAKDQVDATPLVYAYGYESMKKDIMKQVVMLQSVFLFETTKTLNTTQEKIAESLIAKGADVNSRQTNGRTPLHNAVVLTNAYMCLLKADCDVNAQDNFGKTPLHLACLSKNVSAVNELLKFGADINIEDDSYDTVLCSMHYDDSYNLTAFQTLEIHLKKLLALGVHVSDRVKSSYTLVRNRYEKNQFDLLDSDNDSDFEDDDDDCDFETRKDQYFMNCKSELEKMKSIKVNKYSTLYNILYKDSDDMAKHIKNDSLKKILASDDLKTKFPYYSDFLKLQFKRGAVRGTLLNPAKDSLSFLTGIGFPDACSEQILKYLDNDNLRNLIRSVHAVEVVKRKSNINNIDDFEPSVKHLRIEQQG